MGYGMTERRIIKLVTLLIIAFYIFQLMPGALNAVEGFDGHTRNSESILSSDVIGNDVFIISRVSTKPIFQKIPVKCSYFSINPVPLFVSSAAGPYFHERPFDYRKSIKQSIPHYFHGSKYRDEGFVVEI
jgi:hypothetical protein